MAMLLCEGITVRLSFFQFRFESFPAFSYNVKVSEEFAFWRIVLLHEWFC
jgi:hypothetical protein